MDAAGFGLDAAAAGAFFAGGGAAFFAGAGAAFFAGAGAFGFAAAGSTTEGLTLGFADRFAAAGGFFAVAAAADPRAAGFAVFAGGRLVAAVGSFFAVGTSFVSVASPLASPLFRRLFSSSSFFTRMISDIRKHWYSSASVTRPSPSASIALRWCTTCLSSSASRVGMSLAVIFAISGCVRKPFLSSSKR